MDYMFFGSKTTRTAGGIEFAAAGGKRKGREAPICCGLNRVLSTRFEKPNHRSRPAGSVSITTGGVESYPRDRRPSVYNDEWVQPTESFGRVGPKERGLRKPPEV